MSQPTREAAILTATWWKKGTEDEFGRSTFEAPVLLKVTYDDEKKHKYTSNGIENAPNSVIWMEVLSGDNPKKGDMILRGDYSSSAVPTDVGAEIITDAKITDCSLIGGPDDLMLTT